MVVVLVTAGTTVKLVHPPSGSFVLYTPGVDKVRVYGPSCSEIKQPESQPQAPYTKIVTGKEESEVNVKG